MGSWFSSSAKKTKTVVPTASPESVADARTRLKLNPNRVNWGVTGESGAGKSSLINCVRGVGPKDATGAPVGVNECTKVVSVYPFGRSLPIADLVDMPGAGSEMFPVESYFDKMRLDCFDAVVVVTSCRFTGFDSQVIAMLQSKGVPFFLVRTKIDQDIDNNAEQGIGKAETMRTVRAELEALVPGTTRVYLVSSRRHNRNKYDMPALKKAVAIVTEANRVHLTGRRA